MEKRAGPGLDRQVTTHCKETITLGADKPGVPWSDTTLTTHKCEPLRGSTVFGVPRSLSFMSGGMSIYQPESLTDTINFQCPCRIISHCIWHAEATRPITRATRHTSPTVSYLPRTETEARAGDESLTVSGWCRVK